VHVLHISTADEMDYIAGHKDVASVETTPHHLTLEAPGCYERLGTRAQMNPPVRDAAHRAGIWTGLTNGVVDVLGSDHAPHTREEKAKTYPARLFGIARKGRIAVGYDADVTVIDLKRRETITDKWVASRAGWTPYDGVKVTGWPVGTIIRGRKVMWDGDLTTPAQGERVRFLETLSS
jgi:dihydroorotase